MTKDLVTRNRATDSKKVQMLKDLVTENRCTRRFYQDVAIDLQTLRDLADLGRLSASSANRQPLKYILCCDRKKNAEIFSTLTWAILIPEWGGPPEGERPAAYIIILRDSEISKSTNQDHGIAAQSIMLGARARGLGGCIHGGIKKEELCKALDISERYEPLIVVSLGRPKEQVVIDVLEPDGDSKYWRDAEGVHHLPKRRLDDIIMGQFSPD